MLLPSKTEDAGERQLCHEVAGASASHWHVPSTTLRVALAAQSFGSYTFAPVGHWQCVLVDILEELGVLTVPDHRWVQFVASNIVPKQDVILSLKALTTGIDWASLWMEVFLGAHFQTREVSAVLNICPGN